MGFSEHFRMKMLIITPLGKDQYQLSSNNMIVTHKIRKLNNSLPIPTHPLSSHLLACQFETFHEHALCEITGFRAACYSRAFTINFL